MVAFAPDEPDLVVVGKITKPHGIKGELCVMNHAESPSLFGDVPHIYLTSPQGVSRKWKITAWRMHKSQVLVKLKGINDRNQAEELRDFHVGVLRSDLPEPDDGEVYLHDILGFMVQLEDGTELGPFARFIETPGSEVWVIDHPDGEVMLPAVDEVVMDIDMDAQRITVNPPEGLLDIYLKK